MSRIYLAGPMTGIKDFNFPAFKMAAAMLRAEGHEVFSPAENDDKTYGAGFNLSDKGKVEDIPQFSLHRAASDDTQFIIWKMETIAMMPDWEYSSGAFGEWAIAKWLRKKFRYISQAELDAFTHKYKALNEVPL